MVSDGMGAQSLQRRSVDDDGPVDDGPVLVIDTSYGSTVGVLGHDPIVEADSRTHVERLQIDIDHAMQRAGLRPEDLATIVVGVGPGPFTGLRAGIVAAKAMAYATGAQLIGQDVLGPQAAWMARRQRDADGPNMADAAVTLTLAVNDARRRQLYYALYAHASHPGTSTEGAGQGGSAVRELLTANIDYPAGIVDAVNRCGKAMPDAEAGSVRVDVVGRGAGRYADAWGALDSLGEVIDDSVLDHGRDGLAILSRPALSAAEHDRALPIKTPYLQHTNMRIPTPRREASASRRA